MPDDEDRSFLDYLPTDIDELLSFIERSSDDESPRVAETTASDLVSTLAEQLDLQRLPA